MNYCCMCDHKQGFYGEKVDGEINVASVTYFDKDEVRKEPLSKCITRLVFLQFKAFNNSNMLFSETLFYYYILLFANIVTEPQKYLFLQM